MTDGSRKKKKHPELTKLSTHYSTWSGLNTVKNLKQERFVQNKPISSEFGYIPKAILAPAKDKTFIKAVKHPKILKP